MHLINKNSNNDMVSTNEILNDFVVWNNDPKYSSLLNTPNLEICEFCGDTLYTQGIRVGGNKIFWRPTGAEVCKCEDGQVEYLKKKAIQKAKREAEEKEEKDKEMNRRIQRSIKNSGINGRFLRRTFENFKVFTEEQKAIYNVALNYATNFESYLPKQGEEIIERNGFLILGNIGTGKTHIAVSIANYLLNKGTSVICMPAIELLDRIRDTYENGNGQTESSVLNIYKTVPLLIIDDLGKEKPTEWKLSTLYSIINARYEKILPTIVTSNHDPKSLVYRITPPNGDTITAEAIVDRLGEMCSIIPMTGESQRLK
ncbi:MAG: ATP-binding protein [Defluviitaleaceae bacterium]|nr:ATP-binding protein [Defluviitaleaceae bacterium]